MVRRYLEENAVLLGEKWERRHAHYFLATANRYLELPLERWGEVDVEWGNIFKAADWRQRRGGVHSPAAARAGDGKRPRT